MKTFITYMKSRNSILLLGTFIILVPFAYAASQAAEQLSTNTSRDSSNTVLTSTPSYEGAKTELGSFFAFGEKVKKGVIESMDRDTKSFVIQVGTTTILVKNNATTTFYFGEGTEATFDNLQEGSKVYAFGLLARDNSMMLSTKIVIANRSLLLRK